MQRYQKTKLSGRRTLGTKMIEDQTNEEKKVGKKKMVTNAPGPKVQTKSWAIMTQPNPPTSLCTRQAHRIKEGEEVKGTQGATNANTPRTKTEGPGKA